MLSTFTTFYRDAQPTLSGVGAFINVALCRAHSREKFYRDAEPTLSGRTASVLFMCSRGGIFCQTRET